MKKFICTWYRPDGFVWERTKVMAFSPEEALELVLRSEKNPHCKSLEINRAWMPFFSIYSDNPHYDENAPIPKSDGEEVKTIVQVESGAQSAGQSSVTKYKEIAGYVTDSAGNRIGQVAGGIQSQIAPPESSKWAVGHRVVGVCFIVVAIIGLITSFNGSSSNDRREGELIFFGGLASASALFFMAFLIDVLTDIRHYQRETAKHLSRLASEKESPPPMG